MDKRYGQHMVVIPFSMEQELDRELHRLLGSVLEDVGERVERVLWGSVVLVGVTKEQRGEEEIRRLSFLAFLYVETMEVTDGQV